MNKDMQLIRACEMAAICTHHQIGKGDKNEVDKWAVIAMRDILNNADFKAKVIVGEGELDEAPMLYVDEILGDEDSDVVFDLAVDPVESTTGCAYNNSFSGAVLAAAREGSMTKMPEMYMAKFFVSSKHYDALKDFEFHSTKEAFTHLQKVTDKKALIGICLDRPRNRDNIDYIINNGGKVTYIQDGDVLAAMDVINDRADFVFGIGGSPEGVQMASLANAHGGIFYCRFKRYDEVYPRDENAKERTKDELETLKKLGLEMGKVYSQKDLCNDDKARFICSAITTRGGSSLIPLEKTDDHYIVNTIFVSHGITRFIEARYKVDLVKKMIPSIGRLLTEIENI